MKRRRKVNRESLEDQLKHVSLAMVDYKKITRLVVSMMEARIEWAT